MAKAIPNPEIPHNGSLRKHNLPKFTDEAKVRHNEPGLACDNPLAGLNLWGADNPLDSDMNDSSGDQRLLATLAGSAGPRSSSTGADFDKLRAENVQLRHVIADLHKSLEEAAGQSEEIWQERQQEYENILEEKSELIRELHLKVKEFQDARPPVPRTPKEEELIATSEELEQERCKFLQEKKELEELRDQFADDEQIMVRQMRDMEVQMARERADFARQRSELQRILDEIRRELDNVERNGMLNQRLKQLRQRFPDIAAPKGTPNVPVESARREPTTPPISPSATATLLEDTPAKEKDSGLLRRLFGK